MHWPPRPTAEFRPAGRGAPVRAPADRAGRAGAAAIPEVGVLLRAVESEVIPRLLAVHQSGGAPGPMPTLGEIETLCSFALERDRDGALALVRGLMADGMAIDTVYLNLLTSTARMLGELWERDRVSFVDVTVGLCVLHQLLFTLAPDFERGASPGGAGRRALIAPAPGETHVFGALMVAKFFARAGWNVWTELSTTEAELVSLQTAHSFELIGLSVACEQHFETVRAAIGALKRHAPPPVVMLGGRAIDANPERAGDLGADAIAGPPHAAIALAETLVARGLTDER
ncbi:MAG: B12-binding domain-containing protein [Paracoccaceae bacterium]